jgi:2-dehydro-3-deoxyphosphogluconate aldolase / (4S)-4-hydroxy-2-oxoglutarate aldolase
MEQIYSHGQFGMRDMLSLHPFIPVAAIKDGRHLEEVLRLLEAKGIHCIEVVCRTAFAWKAIKALKDMNIPGFAVGVGTLFTPGQVQQAADAEVDFMVSPGLTTALAQAFIQAQRPFLPGIATVSELMNAMEMGVDTCKFFPASLMGGPAMLQQLNAVFPQVSFCPTGGINENNQHEYRHLPNVVSIGGSWMLT